MVSPISAVHCSEGIEQTEKVKTDSTTVSVPVFNYDVKINDEQLIKNPIISDVVKGMIITSTGNMRINPYSPSIMKDDHTAITKSQTHLIDMIKYYEGDRNYYYEAITTPYKDCFGTYTCGFGELTDKHRTQEQAYQKMLTHLEKDAKRIKKLLNDKFGKGTYEDVNFPNSIKEGLIDLAYNKGFGKISSNIELMNSIKNKDYSTVIRNLAYVYSGKKDAEKVENPGLYRRSLSRMILACRDLKGSERAEAIKEIEELYKKAKKCFEINKKDTTEIDSIYNQFMNGKILTKPRSAVSHKIRIDNRFKGKGVESVIRSIYHMYSNPSVSFEEFRKEFLKINGNPQTVKLGQDFKVPVMEIENSQREPEQREEIAVRNKKSAEVDSIPKPENDAASIQKNVPDTLPANKPNEAITNSPEQPDTVTVTKPKKENNFWQSLGDIGKKIGKAIKNFFFGSKKSVSSKKVQEKPIEQSNTQQTTESSQIEESSMEEIKTPMQRMLEDPSVQIRKDGDLEIISLNYEYGPEDNLQLIAKDFGTTELIICNDNNIKTEKSLRDGKTHSLKIQKMGYRIKSGETLSQIAHKFGLSLEILKDMNNIDNISEIQADSVLELPGFVYNVEKNDTLFKISKRVGVSVEQLMKINNLQSSDIKEGQTIKVIYNDADYNIEAKKKKTAIDKVTKERVQTIDMRSKTTRNDLKSRKLLQKKTKVNGKVVATRAVFEPYGKAAKEGPLAGKTIIVNAGHGYSQSGTDIGARGTHEIDDEWLINYDNAMKLKDQLVAQGARVIFLQGHRRLITEALRKAENKGDLFISVHANSLASPTPDRTQFYYREQGVSGGAKSKSLQFARIAERKFDGWIPKNEEILTKDVFRTNGKQDYAQVSFNDKRTGLLKTPLNTQNIPGIIWEVAFMSTEKGRERLRNGTLMKNYAKLMTDSIIEARKQRIF